MYVRSLHIENLRCFESAKVELQFPGRTQKSPPPLPNVNLLLGNNGAGKTTVLKAIALVVLERILSGSGYVPYSLVRRGDIKDEESRARIKARLFLDPIDLGGREPRRDVSIGVGITRTRGLEWLPRGYPEEARQDEVWGELYSEESPAFFLVGYGSTRYVLDLGGLEPIATQRKRRSLRYQRVSGIFEEHLGLAPLGAWLPQVDSDRGREIGLLLNELLPQEVRFVDEMERNEYLFEHCGVPVLQGALSDGYRAYIGWISDLLYNIALGAPQGTLLRDARGVVLVDEIDLHLHPEWQREVVPAVARTLPNLQFVLTTHSPIVAGTLSTQNIFVLEMDGKGASTIRQLEERIHGLNADQILLSPYFNLDTTRAPEAVDELRDLSRKAMDGDPEAALAFLKKLASGTDQT